MLADIAIKITTASSTLRMLPNRETHEVGAARSSENRTTGAGSSSARRLTRSFLAPPGTPERRNRSNGKSESRRGREPGAQAAPGPTHRRTGPVRSDFFRLK